MADTLTNPMHVEVISPDGPIYRETGVEWWWPVQQTANLPS